MVLRDPAEASAGCWQISWFVFRRKYWSFYPQRISRLLIVTPAPVIVTAPHIVTSALLIVTSALLIVTPVLSSRHPGALFSSPRRRPGPRTAGMVFTIAPTLLKLLCNVEAQPGTEALGPGLRRGDDEEDTDLEVKALS
jgi:hypothetical protein